MRSRIAAAALACALLSAALGADEPAPAAPPTPAAVAERVLAALERAEQAVLVELARADVPDPWLVVDELLARGRLDAARAFARAAPRPDTDALPALLDQPAARGPDEDRARALLGRVAGASAQGRHEEALALLDEAGAVEAGPLLATRLATARGFACLGLARDRDGARAYAEAARRAAALGWLARAATVGVTACSHALRAGEHALVLEVAPLALDAARRRADREHVARAMQTLALAHEGLGQAEEAARWAAEAFAPSDAIGDERMATELLEVQNRAAQQRLDWERTLVLTTEVAERHARAGRPAAAARSRETRLAVLTHLDRPQDVLAEEEAVRRANQALGREAGVAFCLSLRGLAELSLGDAHAARAHLEQARDIEQRLGPAAVPQLLCTLDRVAQAYRVLGDRAASLAAARLYLERAQAAGDATSVADAWHTLGGHHHAFGEYAEALDAADRALALTTERGPARERGAALALRGGLYQDLGQSERAALDLAEALRLDAQVGDRSSIASTAFQLAVVLRGLGRREEALRHAETALEVAERAGQHRLQSRCLFLVSNIHRDLGDTASARDAARRAMQRAESQGQPGLLVEARRALAALDYDAGDYDAANAHLNAALGVLEETGDPVERVHVLALAARLSFAAGRHGDALGEARAALAAGRDLAHGVGGELSVAVQEDEAGLFDLGVASAAGLEDWPALAWFLESGRAQGLAASLRLREALGTSGLAPPLAAADDAARRRESAATQALRRAQALGDRAAAKAARAELAAAREEARRVFERIQREARGPASLTHARVDDLPSLCARLGPGEALVLFGRPFGRPTLPMLALVLTREGAQPRPLGPLGEIDAAAAALALERRDEDPGPALAALRRLVAAPLALPASVKRVLVSPDSTLAYVPFALLLPDVEVAYVPSGTTYGLLLEESAKRGEGVLALGDPDYGVESALRQAAQRTRGRESLARLPGTAQEARAVGDVVLLGGEATEAGLREALRRRPRWRAVHLACHGLVDAERPLSSALALTPTGSDDGYLTALDVFRLEVPADLVVLSACETGRGKVYQAEGIVGLTRAFMYAGAPRVLVSLWKVDDEATAALMTRFYARLKEGAPHARALRDAQEHVRGQERWRHPFYWAAWVLWGLPQ